MDPNATLAEMRRLVGRMLDDESEHVDSGDAVRLAALLEALDGWITGGGFLPAAWRRPT